MPWSTSNPPPNTGKLTPRQLRVCIEAANGVMERPRRAGETESEQEGRAMRACWAAARNAGYRPKLFSEGSLAESVEEILDARQIDDDASRS